MYHNCFRLLLYGTKNVGDLNVRLLECHFMHFLLKLVVSALWRAYDSKYVPLALLNSMNALLMKVHMNIVCFSFCHLIGILEILGFCQPFFCTASWNLIGKSFIFVEYFKTSYSERITTKALWEWELLDDAISLVQSTWGFYQWLSCNPVGKFSFEAFDNWLCLKSDCMLLPLIMLDLIAVWIYTFYIKVVWL